MIGSKSPTNFFHELNELKGWCERNNYITLYDILEWTGSGRWKGWKNIEPPTNLQDDYEALLALMHGQAPMHKNIVDSRGGKNREHIQ